MPHIFAFGVVVVGLSVAGATAAQAPPVTTAPSQAVSAPKSPSPQAGSKPKSPSPQAAAKPKSPSPQAASAPKSPSPQVAPAPKSPSVTAPVEAAAAATKPEVPAAKAEGETALPALASQGYNYSPEGRRDPFVTLVKRGSEAAATTAAARVAGLGGLGTSEVTLRGILASQGGYVAMLLGSDEKTYIVRTGDKLADGTIRTITADAMVIVQRINDPLSQQKPREVHKMLRRLDGTN